MVSPKTTARPGKLVVVIGDKLSHLLAKGELVRRYYNPGGVFDEVHIVLTNGDRVNPGAIQLAVGEADVHVHALGDASFCAELGARYLFRLRDYVRRGVALIRDIEPALIRSYEIGLNAYVAAHAAEVLEVPFVLSLHGNPDLDFRALTPWWPSWRRRAALSLQQVLERFALRRADVVAAVYSPIVSYARRMGARDVRVMYNVLNPDVTVQKTSYALHDPPRLLSVGRQVDAKNPEAIIRAMARLERVTLTQVGMGPLHEHLKAVAQACGVASRVTFIPSIPNSELVRSLPDYDLFVAHNIYVGVAKAVLEPMLAGLPVIVSKRPGVPNPELDGDWVVSVDNPPQGYAAASLGLLSDDTRRAILGRRAAAHAARYHPRVTEQAYAELYRHLLSARRGRQAPEAGAGLVPDSDG